MSQAKLANLQIALQLRDRQFTAGMKAAERASRRLELRTKTLSYKVKSLSRSFKNFSKRAKSLATAVIGVGAAIGYTVKKVVDTNSALAKSADAVGVTTDAYQVLSYAAQRTGVSTTQFASNMTAFVKRVGEAKTGAGTLVTSLNKLNPALLSNLQNSKNQQQALGLVSNAMKNAQSATERAAIANAAFGRSGVPMVNMLKNGAAGLKIFGQQADDLGIIIDEKLIRRAEVFDDKLLDLGLQFKANFTTAVLTLSETFDSMINKSQESWQMFIRLIGKGFEALGSYAQYIFPENFGQKLQELENWGKQISNNASIEIESIKRVRQATEEFNKSTRKREPLIDIDENSLVLAEKMKDKVKEVSKVTEAFNDSFRQSVHDAFEAGALEVDKFAGSVLKAIQKVMIDKVITQFLSAFSFGGGTTAPAPAGAPATPAPAGRGLGSVNPAPLSFLGNTRPIIKAKNAHAPKINVNVINQAGVDAQVSQKNNGQNIDINIMLKNKVTGLFNSGSMDNTLKNNYGITRKGY